MSKPRIKTDPDAHLLKAIYGSAVFYDVCPEEQANIAGMAIATWYRRLKQPETFTVKEFRRMARRYEWDCKTICQILDIREAEK